MNKLQASMDEYIARMVERIILIIRLCIHK